MRFAHVRPDTDVGFGDRHQRANLSGCTHAQFHDRHLRTRPQLEQRQRQADVIVQVALVPERPVPQRQKRRGHFLRRRLSRAAGDRHDARARLPANIPRQRLQRPRGVLHFDHDRRRAHRRSLARRFHAVRAVDHDARRATSDRARDEVVAVEALAMNGEEQVAGLHRPRIDAHRVDPRVGAACREAAVHRGRHITRRHRHDTRAPLLRLRVNAAFATATSSNGSVRSPIT